jgi:TusA-related sulfurtransferase
LLKKKEENRSILNIIMNEIKPDETLDLRGVPCPKNSAQAIVKLETMDTEEILEVIIDDGEPIENVPASIEEEYYEIVDKRKIDNKHWGLLIKVL